MGEDKEFLESLLQDYFAECDEHIISVKRNLLQLEEDLAHGVINENIFNEIFRSFHTIKGLSAMIGFNDIEKISHELESYLKTIKSGEKTLSEKSISIIQNGVKFIEEILLAKKENKEVNIDEIIKTIKADLTQENVNMEDKRKEESPKIISKEGKTTYQVIFYPSLELSEKGINVDFIKSKLQEISEITKITPKIDDAQKMYFEFIINTDQEEKLKNFLDYGVKYTPIKYKEKKEVKQATSQPISPSNFIRVDLKKLDDLMRIVGELVITKSRLQDHLRNLEDFLPPNLMDNLTETIKSLDRNLRYLREGIMKVRLVPIGEAFERMQFVIKDLIKESHKKIELHILGKETEIDKYIVEKLVDPLLHLVRNAVSHGIEPEEERIKKGKDPTGHIYLRAYTIGDEVYIEVENDGREIDREKIKKKALDLGLIKSEEEINSDEKILEIICSPNFSTRDEADRESGRGVGMAVVKSTVNELGGTIYLKSNEKSTCFTLKLPLTLAIIDTIIVETEKEKYAIPQSAIREIVEIKNEEIINFKGLKFITLRGTSIPVVFLADILKTKREEEKEKYFILIIEKEEEKLGLIVEKVVNIREAVIRPINDPIILKNPIISGATDFGDGKVVLILNPEGLLRKEVIKNAISN